MEDSSASWNDETTMWTHNEWSLSDDEYTDVPTLQHDGDVCYVRICVYCNCNGHWYILHQANFRM